MLAFQIKHGSHFQSVHMEEKTEVKYCALNNCECTVSDEYQLVFPMKTVQSGRRGKWSHLLG